MRTSLVCAIISCAAAAPALASSPTLQLRIERDGLNIAATCTLIHRQDVADGSILSFVTAGHLFRGADGERLASPGSVKVLVGGGREIAVAPSNVKLPSGGVVDLALLSATVPVSDLSPAKVVFTSPPPGSDFRVSGFDAGGTPAESVQRVRIRTSALLLGDREAGLLSGCDGAPAISSAGVFGLVASCERGKVVVISLFEIAEPFLRHHIRGFSGVTSRPTARDPE